MQSKQAREFIERLDSPGRVLEINYDAIPKISFKTPFICNKCGSYNHSIHNFLVKCNDCGNTEEKLLKI